MQVLKGTMQRYLSLSVFSFVWDPLEHFSLCLESVRPPHGLVQTSRHGCGGVTVAAVCLHTFTLAAQTRVHQAVGPSGARGPRAGQQTSGRALASAVSWGHHGELIGARSCAVVQVGVGLEVLALII